MNSYKPTGEAEYKLKLELAERKKAREDQKRKRKARNLALSKEKEDKAKTARQKKARAAKRAHDKKLLKEGQAILAKNRGAHEHEKVYTEHEKEFMERQLAKVSLLAFIKRFNPTYKAGWVHEDICRRLEKFLKAIDAGESPRLMLFMPPRHGKSMIASHHFPAWGLGHFPHLEYIAASYGSSLPNKFSRQVRAFLRDQKYKVLFPHTKLDRTNENVEGWSTTQGGGYIPAGVGGGITGKGAHVLIIDDPVKDAEEADSEVIRSSVWDWWGSTAYTRLAPNAGVLVIQTRWHDDDLSGRMIMQMKDELKDSAEMEEMWHDQGMDEEEIETRVAQNMREIDQWEIIEYPALALDDEYLNTDGSVTSIPKADASKFLRAKDEALHEERFDYTRLRKIKRTLQPRHWSALYQQNPIPEEGMYFTKGMFRRTGTPDFRTLPIVITWDLAVGLKQQNDYTVGIVACLDYYDQVHIIDMVRGKWDTDVICDAIIDVHDRYNKMTTGNVRTGIESGSIQMSIMPHLKKKMKKRRLFPSFVPEDEMRPITDKHARARPLQGRMMQGAVFFPHDSQAPWMEALMHELLRFSGGVHDDIVDAMAWMARVMANTTPPKFDKPKPIKSWKDRLANHMQDHKDPMCA
jgi:predicted phage terminase large subunit-like protein